jgi:anaphase-promoting complex subunit 8
LEDAVCLAKTYFELREYERAAYALRDATSPLAVFLRFYSLYLVGSERGSLNTTQQAIPSISQG